jgi:Uma2 family endonuclease
VGDGGEGGVDRPWQSNRIGCYNIIMAAIDVFTAPSVPAIVVPSSRMTLDDYRDWVYSKDFPDRGRITYVSGRLIIEMSPERIDTHARIKGEISFVLAGIVRESDLGEFYIDGVWITNRAAGVSNEPDAAFATWESLKSGRLAPPADRPIKGEGIELVGTPDWVCEIVSDTSEEKDTELLVAAYHKAGIREYWLIDARGAEIDFRLLVSTPSGYQAAEVHDEWRTSPIFGRDFQIIRYRNQLDRWQYELRQRIST